MVDFVVHLLVVVWCGGTAVVGKVWFSVVLRQLVGVKFAFFFDFFKFKSSPSFAAPFPVSSRPPAVSSREDVAKQPEL